MLGYNLGSEDDEALDQKRTRDVVVGTSGGEKHAVAVCCCIGLGFEFSSIAK